MKTELIEEKYSLEEFLDEWEDHDESEPCPICGGRLKEDPIGGFYLICPRCGWRGW